MSQTILRVDASMRKDGSVSRQLADQLISSLAQRTPSDVVIRDLMQSLPFIDENWIGANFTDPAERSAEQRSVLAQSDALVAELKAADVLVLAVPIYNFSVPAAFKAWIDLVARARETFQYTENGPIGLLERKKAYIIIASGGVPLGSEADHVSPWIKQVLGFLGITDVKFIDGSGLNIDEQAAVERAQGHIKAVA